VQGDLTLTLLVDTNLTINLSNNLAASKSQRSDFFFENEEEDSDKDGFWKLDESPNRQECDFLLDESPNRRELQKRTKLSRSFFGNGKYSLKCHPFLHSFKNATIFFALQQVPSENLQNLLSSSILAM